MTELRIENLSKSYGSQQVLNELTVSTSHRVIGISGSNGSGKSTLLQCIAGLLKPGGGSVSWTIEEEIFSPNELNGRIGYAAPYVELYEGLSVLENLEFLKELKRDSLPYAQQDIDELLEKFEASDFSGKLYGELSTGQRQRVKLAAACIHDPPILCLDEPGSNLDEPGRKLVSRTVREFAEKNRIAVIASNQPEELAIAQEILDLDNLF